MSSSEKTSNSSFPISSRCPQTVDEAFNSAILRKMEWMARQFRKFNDVNSIVHWAGAISSLRNLLLPLSTSSTSGLLCEPLPHMPNNAPAVQPSMTNQDNAQLHKYNKPPSPTKHLTPWLNRYKAVNKPLASADSPTLLQSPPFQQNFNESSAFPLKHNVKRINQENLPTIQLQRSKLIRINISPSTAALTKISPAPGMHIWEGHTPQEPNKDHWAFKQFDGGKEYKILKLSSDPQYPFIVQEIVSGKEFDMKLDENLRLHL